MDKNFIIKNNVLIKYKGLNKNIIIPEGIKKIDKQCFFANEIVESISLPSSVKEIDVNSFFRCDNLKEINLENIEKIKKGAFFGCKNLKQINLNNLKYLASYSFKNSGIEELIMPKTLKIKAIDFKECFYDCGLLKKVEINCELKDCNDYIFNENNYINEIKIKNELDFNISILQQLHYLEKIEINNPNYKIKDGMVYSTDETKLIWCPAKLNIKEYKIPDNVKIIKQNCFKFNKNIEKIILGKSIEIIEEEAFAKSSIEKIECNSNLKKIKTNAFVDMKKLKELDLSKANIYELNIENIGIDKITHSYTIMINEKTIILPNKIKNLIIDKKLFFTNFKCLKSKQKINQNILEKLKPYECKFLQTLDELIEEGISFREANKMIKEQER